MFLFFFSSDYSYRYGPPTRTEYRLVVENLSSRISWQVRTAAGTPLGPSSFHHLSPRVPDIFTFTWGLGWLRHTDGHTDIREREDWGHITQPLDPLDRTLIHGPCCQWRLKWWGLNCWMKTIPQCKPYQWREMRSKNTYNVCLDWWRKD